MPVLLFIFSAAAVLLFGVTPVRAEEETQYYYVLYLTYDKGAGTLRLSAEDNVFPVSVDLYDFTRDDGSGSQFYARVLNSNNEEQTFSNKSNQYYLGQWDLNLFWDGMTADGKPKGGAKEVNKRDIKVSIPYFRDGKLIEIYNTQTNELALSVNVDAFSQNKGPGEIVVPLPDKKTSADEQKAEAEKEKLQKTTSWVVYAIIFVIVIAGGGLVIWFVKKGLMR